MITPVDLKKRIDMAKRRMEKLEETLAGDRSRLEAVNSTFFHKYFPGKTIEPSILEAKIFSFEKALAVLKEDLKDLEDAYQKDIEDKKQLDAAIAAGKNCHTTLSQDD